MKTSEAPDKLIIVLFNRGMFVATSESDKPAITVELTEDQKAIIQKHLNQGMDILSIHVENTITNG